MLFGQKRSTATYRIAFVVRLLLTIHVGYMYISFSADTQIGKGGTFIEASLESVNFLPYITTNDGDKFYQSLLFNGCVFPSISGTEIAYREDLCDVTTRDWQTYRINVKPSKFWTDGTPITLNDIYFTYNTILKENYRNIGALDPYKNIQMNIVDDTLEVTFPSPSVDNMIFLTNFALPAHLLANQSLEHYISRFHADPIGSNCAVLGDNNNDPTSIVFDLGTCEDTLLRFYQVKQFGSEPELQRYILSKSNTIDMIVSSDIYHGYTRNQVILNRYLTLFFNTQSTLLTTELRKELGSWLAHNYFVGGQTNTLIQDPYLFDAFGSGDALTTSGYLSQFLGTPEAVPTSGENQVPDLQETIYRDSQETQEFYVSEPIDDKVELVFNFSNEYDRISVSYNNGVEYYPESFDAQAGTTQYNLNPVYRNVAKGRNLYTIKGYLSGQHVDTNTLVIHYLAEPTLSLAEGTIGAATDFTPLKVIAFDDPISQSVVKRLDDLFAAAGIDEYFEYEIFDDTNTFAGKISSQDHDIVIRTINMGLRKDMSNLVNSSLANINPSGYVNPQLAANINNFFLSDTLAKADIKAQIDATYQQDMPFLILGKELSSMNIRSDLEFPYPFRLYVLGWRKDFIKDLQLFKHLSINWDKVFDTDNMVKFLGNKLGQ